MQMKTIKLRGHHLENLLEYTCGRDLRFSHKNASKRFRKLCSKYGYSREVTTMAMVIWKEVYEKEDMEIEITNGLDEICGCCNLEEKGCSGKKLRDEDVSTADYFKLKVGAKYLCEEVIKALRGCYLYEMWKRQVRAELSKEK